MGNGNAHCALIRCMCFVNISSSRVTDNAPQQCEFFCLCPYNYKQLVIKVDS